MVRNEAISDPRFGSNILRAGGIKLYLFAEIAKEYAQILDLLRVIWPPDRRENRSMGEDTAGMLYHMMQQIKFLRREPYLSTSNSHKMTLDINHEVANLNIVV